MKSRMHGTDWGTLRRVAAYGQRELPSLLKELCRVLHASESAILCGMRHGQLTIDGYIIRPEHLNRWTPDRLAGRQVRMVGRWGVLYGAR